MNKIRNIKLLGLVAIIAVAVVLTAKATIGQVSQTAQHQHYYGCEHYLQNSNYSGHEHYYGCGHDPANVNYSRQWDNNRNYADQYSYNRHRGQQMSRQNWGDSRAYTPAPASYSGGHYYGCGCGYGGWDGNNPNGRQVYGGWGCW